MDTQLIPILVWEIFYRYSKRKAIHEQETNDGEVVEKNDGKRFIVN